MLTIIPLVIIIIGLGVVLIIVARHAPQAASLDVAKIPEEREAVLKSTILEKRLFRKLDSLAKVGKIAIVPVKKIVSKHAGTLFQRIKLLERTYRFQTGLPDSSKKTDAKSRELVEQAAVERAKQNTKHAESLYLTAIKMNPQMVEAYKGLGDTYIETRDWNQARETIEYIIKTWPQDDEGYALLAELELAQGDQSAAKDHYLHALSINNERVDYHLGLAELYLTQDDKEKALSSLQKAQGLEPNNPKILDRLFAVSVLLGNKILAEEVLEKIKTVNPDHGRLAEYEQKVKDL